MTDTTPKRIARVAVPVPVDRLFDYEIPPSEPSPALGGRVQVPFAGRRLIGICAALNPDDAHDKAKPLLKVLDTENFFGEPLWQLARWLHEYYQHPLGEVLTTILPTAARSLDKLPATTEEFWELVDGADVDPPGLGRAPRQQALYEQFRSAQAPISATALRQSGVARNLLKALAAKGLIRRTNRAVARTASPRPGSQLALNTEQQTVLDQLLKGLTEFTPSLLFGITGSGKTEIYLRLIEAVLALGRQVLVLVPEIALTPQTVARFEDRFGSAAVIHSAMTDRARLKVWLQAGRGEVQILIGTRSAVLTPFADLGLIVVDEEHDASFKQQDGLRYSARDVAVKRAQQAQIPLLLGSATPSFESLHNAASGRYQQLNLTHRAGSAVLPSFHLLDLRGHKLDNGLAEDLLRVVSRHLEADGQILVFLNRRGFAPSLLCGHCNWRALCPACDRPMTMHRMPEHLVCHHCGSQQPLPESCPDCGKVGLVPVGQGTQRAEATLRRRFPDVPVYRIDRDTVRSKARLEEQLDAIQQGHRAILIGTQMLAKGHHFPNVTLVAVVNADGGFLSPDFRAPERTAQLIIQVAGRAGRAERPGEVYIQSYQPDNPLLSALLNNGYSGFAERELAARAASELPPFRPIALLRCESSDAAAARNWLREAAGRLPDVVDAYGPAPAIIERVAERWRFQVLVTASNRARLHSGLRALRTLPATPANVRFAIDIDPYDTF